MSNSDEIKATSQLRFDITNDDIEIIDDQIADFISGDFDYDIGGTPVQPWIWADPEIFSEEVKAAFLELPAAEQPRFAIEAVDRFYDKWPEFREFDKVIIWEQPETLLKHFKSLTLDDFRACEIRQAEPRFDRMQRRIQIAENALKDNPIDYKNIKLKAIWPIIAIRNDFVPSELCAFFYQRPPKYKRKKGGELHAQLEAMRALNNGFGIYKQGPLTNAYTSVNKSKGGDVDKVTGKWTYNGEQFTIELLKGNDLTGTTAQLFMFAVMLTSETHCRSKVVSFNLTDYMLERGISDKKEARKQVKKNLKTIAESRITYEKDNYAFDNYGGINFVDQYDYSNGNITIIWTDSFFRLLKRYPIRPIHPVVFQINDHKNPNSIYFYNKIAELKNIRVDKQSQDENIISVKTLLSAAVTIPAYEDMKKAGNYDYKRRIIEPFERDLNALDSALTWEYCKPRGQKLSLKEWVNMDYSTFEALNIRIKWRAYPDQSRRIERANERREKLLELNEIREESKAKEQGKIEAKKG